MGHKFLKHIERTRLLVFMVDIFGFQLSPKHPHRDCLANVYALNKELELYDPSLLEKPSVLLLNKMDKEGAHEIFTKVKPLVSDLASGLEQCPEELRPKQVFKFDSIVPISAMNSSKITQVKSQLRRTLVRLAEKQFLADEDQVKEKLRQRVGVVGPKIT